MVPAELLRHVGHPGRPPGKGRSDRGHVRGQSRRSRSWRAGSLGSGRPRRPGRDGPGVHAVGHVGTPSPGFYWIHGGATVLGNVAMDDLRCKKAAVETGCVVASVEYRLAPEHPHPAPIEDCYAGFEVVLRRRRTPGSGPEQDRRRRRLGGRRPGRGAGPPGQRPRRGGDHLPATHLSDAGRPEHHPLQSLHQPPTDVEPPEQHSRVGAPSWESRPARRGSLPTPHRPEPRTCRTSRPPS